MQRKLWMPKQPRWAQATLAIGAAAFLSYLAATWRRPLDPARGAGLVFGIAAAVIFIVEALYPARRKLLSRPLGDAQRWIQLHIWMGSLAALLVLLHCGFRRPGGTMGWLLLSLTIWVTLSGLLGVFLQKFFPAALAQGLSVEALFERIPELVARLPGEADKLVEGTSDVLTGFYLSEVRPMLAGVSPSWGYLTDLRGGREKRLQTFTRIAPFVSAEERERLEDLKTLFVEKLELDAQFSVQRTLRTWTVLHVPPAALLLGLLVIHVAAFLLY